MVQKVAFFLCLSVAVVLGSPVFAGDVSIGTPDQMIQPGDTFDATISITTPFDTSGFSYGLCDGDGAFTCDAVVSGPAFGVDPQFFAPAINPDPGEAGDHTVGCVYNFGGTANLPAGTQAVSVATYTEVLGDPIPNLCTAASGGGGHPLAFCDILGTPLVVTTIVDGAGTGASPGFDDSCVSVDMPPVPADFKFIAPFVTLTAGTTATVDLSMAQLSGAMTGQQGFSFGLTIGGTQVTLTGDAQAGPLAATNGGMGAQFVGSNLDPAGGPGYTAGVVVSFAGADFLVVGPGDGDPVITLTFEVGGVEGDNVPLTWRDDLGDPLVINTVVVDGEGQDVDFCDGRIDIVETPPVPFFLRGDCNDDGIVNIADGVNIINEVFDVGPSVGNCEAACDANRDGMKDLSDAIYIFNYRFLNGPPPSAPFPDCGEGAESDTGNCDQDQC